MEKSKESYVLLTDKESYFVEYLLKQLILSDSITQAMTFENHDSAIKFKLMLFESCNLKCSVNTYIK